jgi:hypothetical protein
MDVGTSGPPATDSPAWTTPRATQIAIRTLIPHIFLIVTTLNEKGGQALHLTPLFLSHIKTG